MSPPTKVYTIKQQEGLIVNPIDDLDTADTGKDKNIASLTTKSLLDKDAVEHEESSQKSPISEAVQEKGEEICFTSVFGCQKGSGGEKYELLMVDLANTGHTPDCLGEKTHDHLQNHIDILPKNCIIQDDSLNDSVDYEVKLINSKSQPLVQRRKRKKKAKLTSKKKNYKKQRILLPLSESHCCYASFSGCCKTAGGGTQTTQTGGNGNVNGGFTPVANYAIRNTTVNGNGNCGGGSGDGGEDGEDPRKGKKHESHDCPFKAGISRKQKKKTHSSPDEMEVDDAASAKDSPMDVDPLSKDSLVNVGKETSEVSMATNNQVLPVKEQAARPEKESPRPADMLPSQELLIAAHTRINHSVYCDKKNCRRCQWVKNHMSHYLSEGKNGCLWEKCLLCKSWPHVLKFHQEKCKIHDCHVCVKIKDEPNPPSKQNIPACQNDLGYAQTVPELNVPSSGSSLDTEEAVIYCDDGLHLRHFKEHEHYSFKEKGFVGKGGHGEVYDVVVHPGVKNKYPCFGAEGVVAKKAVVEDDEKAVLQVVATHPNFVKTYLVIKKTEGCFKNLIFMEKCDMSLRDYLDRIQRNGGQGLNLCEAMHFWTQVLDAIVYLHNRRIPIIHKDIKSSNVLLTCLSNLVRAKLADFGAVKLLHNEFTQPGLQPKGTLVFVAPEVLRMQVHGRPADVYSMGIFLLELLVGDVRNCKVAMERLKDMDPDLAELVEWCLKPVPSARPTAVQIRENNAVRKYSCKGVQEIVRNRFQNLAMTRVTAGMKND